MNDKIYLLGGNGASADWWQASLPYFRQLKPQAIELPGFGSHQSTLPHDVDGYARALLQCCQPNGVIVACGVSALIVLRASSMRPAYFRKIILLAPIGAFLWQRRLARLLSTSLGAVLAKFLLSHFTFLFMPLFASQPWTRQQLRILSLGYQRCSSFTRWCRLIKPHNALRLFDTLQENICIVWGSKDRIANIRHAAAWESILARCQLSFTFVAHWGHYPYLEDAQNFAHTIENVANASIDVDASIVNAHSKAGRLQLARQAGLRTPEFWVASRQNLSQVIATLAKYRIDYWAVRGSSFAEDQLQQSQAGQSASFLGVATKDIASHAEQVLQDCEQLVIQEYIPVRASGVAFVRNLSMEIEWFNSRTETVTAGHATPYRLSLDLTENINAQIARPIQHANFDIKTCIAFVRRICANFHYAALDIEWGWNGRHFYLFQVRPISQFHWKRLLSSANIDELLPTQPSLLMENTQRLASNSIPQIYALWDCNVLEQNEAFTCTFNDASYLNLEVYLASLRRWGLPSRLLSQYIGASVPATKFNAFRFFSSIPLFLRMLFKSRRELRSVARKLAAFETELDEIKKLALTQQLATLQSWFLRLYVYVVQTNLVLNSAIVSSLGNWYGRPVHAYTSFSGIHRVAYESDPASPRYPQNLATPLKIEKNKTWRWSDRAIDRLLLPGNQAFYIEQREWFRDNYTRLYYRLHFLVKQLDESGLLFSPYFNPREISGSFSQHNGETVTSHHNPDSLACGEVVLIYPGQVSGVIDSDILVVDRLDPGKFRYYCRFKAVIARGGGYLSHAAILLRELKIPSAFVPDVPVLAPGTHLQFDNGKLRY